MLKLDPAQHGYYDKSDGCTPNLAPCTSGFTSYANGKQGVLTAGHCLEDFSIGDKGVGEMYANGKELFVPLRVYDVDNWFDDIGFAREVYASADPRGRIWLSPTAGWRDITSLLPAAAPDGAVRCIKSAGPLDIGDPPTHQNGYKCGTVKPNHGNWCLGFTCKYTRVDNSTWNDFPRGGSSGGPWFYLGSAAGIHKRSYTDAGVYYRLEHAKIAISGLFIYCGGVNQYLCSWP